MRELSIKSFSRAIDISIERNVDFIIIGGDLFDTSLPSIDNIKSVVEKLKECNDKNIPIYTIPGSHDYSPSGKTFLSVLEKAGLIKNVSRGTETNGFLRLTPTIDKKTNALICGILGRKGMLDKEMYSLIDPDSLQEELKKHQGFKIFMFHNAVTEIRPKWAEKIDSIPLKKLPSNFNYYAGGHIHYVYNSNEFGPWIVYPGPTFPNNFRELENLTHGTFFIYDTVKMKPELIPLNIVNVESLKFNCNDKTPEQIENQILEEIKTKQFNNTVVTLRLFGTLLSGKPSDINFKTIFEEIEGKSAYYVMKSTTKLTSKEYEEIKVEHQESVDEIEDKILEENTGNSVLFDKEKEKNVIKTILKALSIEKDEGETNSDYEEKVWREVKNTLQFE